MALVSLALAFLFAIFFVVVMTATLPPTDLASGSGPFSDPLVFPVMSIFAGIAGVLTFPFVHFALRERKLLPGVAIAASFALGAIVFLTPTSPPLGFLGSFVGYGVGLAVAWSRAPRNARSGHCHRCGHDLRGSSADRPCPECGAPVPAPRV